MANWYGTARSNYFKVNDEAEFRKDLEGVEIQIKSKDGAVVLFGGGDSGGWPSGQWDENDEEFVEVDLCGIIQEHIAPGDCAILMEVGAEKLCYLTGRAVAVTAAEVSTVSLDDIYAVAAKMTDSPVCVAEH